MIFHLYFIYTINESSKLFSRFFFPFTRRIYIILIDPHLTTKNIFNSLYSSKYKKSKFRFNWLLFFILNCSLVQINKYADLFVYFHHGQQFQRIHWDFEYIIIRIDSSKTIINKIESSVLDYGWSFFFFLILCSKNSLNVPFLVSVMYLNFFVHFVTETAADENKRYQ